MTKLKKVKVKWNGLELEGVLLPKTSRNKDDIVIVKLKNGYNIGVKPEQIEEIGEFETKKCQIKVENLRETNKKITIIGTGGTIASRVDYTTGGVVSQFTVDDFLLSFPELKYVATYKAKQPFNILSEDMDPEKWQILAEEVYESLNEDCDGVIITHGTDTMHYTSSYLSFAIQNINKPIILVGAQRSSDRPSTDTPYNLVGASLFAINDFSGVFVCMHKDSNDKTLALHVGTRVRKMHTSRRDAFRSINFPIVAELDLELSKGKIQNYNLKINVKGFERKNSNPKLINGFHDNIALCKIYPGIKNLFRHYSEYDGIILEGTGLGHAPQYVLNDIKSLIESGIFVGMTSQCIYGRTHCNVYSRGVELNKLGVVYLEDMLPEVAYVKLGWIMAQTKDINKIKEKMLKPIFYEITERSLFVDF